MKILKIIVGPLRENSYLAYCENTKEGVLVDPGAESNEILKVVEENGVKLKAILLTHAHFDHIGAVPEIKQKFDVPVILHKAEQEVLGNFEYNHSGMYGSDKIELTADKMLDEGEAINFGDETLKIIFTPGHTPGGSCYYSEKAHVVFTGDTLFANSIGRCDFYKGNMEQLIDGIKTKLFVLPDDVTVYTGHEGDTTIGHEKVNNPYARLDRK